MQESEGVEDILAASSEENVPSEKACASDKVQFLGMTQQIIARMANCSVTLKVCCSTLVAGMYVFLSASHACGVASFCALLVPFVVVVCFFGYFDARYLQQERCYRVLYESILKAPADDFDRTLKMPNPCKEEKTLKRQCFRSWSVAGFYSALLLGIVVVFVAMALAA